jgi:HTH-type transcriptional regulator, pleiotropic regulator of extracellular virulence genes
VADGSTPARPDQDTGPFFRRFRLSGEDLDEAVADVGTDRETLEEISQATDPQAIMAAHLRLGANLIPLGHEAEAARHLERALDLARRRDEADPQIEALLQLGTARQYLGDRGTAQELFQQGIYLSQQSGIRDHVHVLLHHRGRCYVEQQRPDLARQCFEQALVIREQLGDDEQLGDERFITSTRAALEELDAQTA